MSGINSLGMTVITTGNPYDTTPAGRSSPSAGSSFKDILEAGLSRTKPEALTFSKHAKARTEQRGISLSQADMNRLNGAVGKARDKGLTDTLVYMDNTAFIVNVPNKVVVTVVDGADAGNNVFTNIDGAVIV